MEEKNTTYFFIQKEDKDLKSDVKFAKYLAAAAFGGILGLAVGVAKNFGDLEKKIDNLNSSNEDTTKGE